MILSYSEYIRLYIHRLNKSSPPAPGEHHFVSAYLVPKLYSINGKVPDYINPDGTKSILGYVVYYQDGQHHFGIHLASCDCFRSSSQSRWLFPPPSQRRNRHDPRAAALPIASSNSTATATGRSARRSSPARSSNKWTMCPSQDFPPRTSSAKIYEL